MGEVKASINADLSVEDCSRPSLCLNMIVRNEAHVILETLRNLTSYLTFDYWVICDTGSTDGTQALIQTFFDECGIPGELHEDLWRDFAHNRTLALQRAFDKTDYVLIFDADDSIGGDFALPEVVAEEGAARGCKYPADECKRRYPADECKRRYPADEYRFKFGSREDGILYTRTLMVNNRQRWRYYGVVHEFIVREGAEQQRPEGEQLRPEGGLTTLPPATLEGDYWIFSGRKGDRNRLPGKGVRDAETMIRAVRELEQDPTQPMYETLLPRYVYNIGNSYLHDRRYEEAITWFERRLQLPMGWSQENYLCCIRIARCHQALGDAAEAMRWTAEALRYDTCRADAVFELMNALLPMKRMRSCWGYYAAVRDSYEGEYLQHVAGEHWAAVDSQGVKQRGGEHGSERGGEHGSERGGEHGSECTDERGGERDEPRRMVTSSSTAPPAYEHRLLVMPVQWNYYLPYMLALVASSLGQWESVWAAVRIFVAARIPSLKLNAAATLLALTPQMVDMLARGRRRGAGGEDVVIPTYTLLARAWRQYLELRAEQELIDDTNTPDAENSRMTPSAEFAPDPALRHDSEQAALQEIDRMAGLEMVGGGAGGDNFVVSIRHIAIIAPGGWTPWTGRDVEVSPMGGSETWAVRLAVAMMQARGEGSSSSAFDSAAPPATPVQLHVFHHSRDPEGRGFYRGVRFYHVDQAESVMAAYPFADCLVSRYAELLPLGYKYAARTWLVLHDVVTPQLKIQQHEKLAGIVTLTRWHAKLVRDAFEDAVQVVGEEAARGVHAGSDRLGSSPRGIRNSVVPRASSPPLSPRSLFVIIPGFGPPHVDDKLQILRRNVARIMKHPWSKVTFHVCCFVTETEPTNSSPTAPRLTRDPGDTQLAAAIRRGMVDAGVKQKLEVSVHRESGIVGEFLVRHATPKNIAGYDMVLAILDDAELNEDWDWEIALRAVDELQLDCLSPSLVRPPHPGCYGWKYMIAPHLQRDDDAEVVIHGVEGEETRIRCISPPSTPAFSLGVAEFFAYLMPVASWNDKYYPLLDAANPWNWGVEYAMPQVGMRVARANQMTLTHHINRRGGLKEYLGVDPKQGMQNYLAARNLDPDPVRTSATLTLGSSTRQPTFPPSPGSGSPSPGSGSPSPSSGSPGSSSGSPPPIPVHVFGHGMDLETFPADVVARKRFVPRFIYSAFPNRGLVHLLRMWRDIRAAIPEATLELFVDLENEWANSAAPADMKEIKAMLGGGSGSDSLPGVTLHGWVGRRELSEAWLRSCIFLYPCTFAETYCLSALEAAAAGALLVAPPLAALGELHEDQRTAFIVPGDPASPSWQRRVVDRLAALTEEHWREIVDANRERANRLGWKARGEAMLQLLGR